MRDIAIAVVCYNNDEEVVEFAKNLALQSAVNRIRLLVTCNSVEDFDGFKEKLNSAMPSAIVYDPGQNLGYLPGCLYGVKNSLDNYSWILICNTDIAFVENNFFEKAIGDVEKDVWCVGPDIRLLASGIHQNPFIKNRPSKLKVNIWKIAYSCYPLFWLYFEMHDIKPQTIGTSHVNSERVYAVHGSCFFIKKECLDAIINEKKIGFMYGEELLVAEVVETNNKKTYYNAKASIIHNENQVTGKIGNKRKQKWFKESLNNYLMIYQRKKQ